MPISCGVKKRSTAFQVACRDFQFLRIGKRAIVVQRLVGVRIWSGAEDRSGGAEARNSRHIAE